jgi:hypothetical protein
MRVDYSAEYDVVSLEESGNYYILDLKAKTRTVSYDRLKMWVIKENNILEKVICFAASGKQIKTLDFKEVKNFGKGILRPAVVETTSPLYRGYKSVMIYSKIKKKNLPDEVFTLDYLSRLNELR